MVTAPAATQATMVTSRIGEYGSSILPTMPAVIAIPAIIISQTTVAAAARRLGAVAAARKASTEVPVAPTPSPISA